MKKRILIFDIILIIIGLSISSCNKQVDYTSDIIALKASITALQKRSDSLASALSVTNTNLSSVSKSVDSVKIQLSAILIELNSLNNQMTTANANIVNINAQIAVLSQQYADLLAKLNEILAQLTVTSTTLSNGLIAYYPFNGNLRDSSGNANNGTMVGTMPYGSDHRNNSGSSLVLGAGRVTTNTSMFNFQYGESFSLSFWVLDNGSSSGRLISTENLEGNFRIASYGNGIYAYNYGSGPYLYDTLKLNTWVHISFVYSNRSITLYKNGILKSSSTLTTTELLHYGTPFTIGAKAASAYDTWNGRIDDLRIYNRVLTKPEAEYLFTH
ncbi:MAG: LamG-like jellyroll fold domain-containing protein [Sediminibacterium sp.]